jgi:hypothetical protein
MSITGLGDVAGLSQLVQINRELLGHCSPVSRLHRTLPRPNPASDVSAAGTALRHAGGRQFLTVSRESIRHRPPHRLGSRARTPDVPIDVPTARKVESGKERGSDKGHRAVVAGAVPHMIAGRKNDADVLLRKRNRLLDKKTT